MSDSRLTPRISDRQTGDLVWPRADHQVVFFQEGNPQGASWLQARAEQVQVSSEMMDRFQRDSWVGHVALIEVIDGVPWVVDATPDRSGPAQPSPCGVATQTYQAFLDDAAHTQSHVWHGRLVGPPPGFGQFIVQAAKAHLGKPYAINPVSLEEDDAFYCSKLIWHAVRDALGIEWRKPGLQVPQPWFTPWDVMQAEGVQLLYAPAGKSYRG
jgi:hypothetical protein